MADLKQWTGRYMQGLSISTPDNPQEPGLSADVIFPTTRTKRPACQLVLLKGWMYECCMGGLMDGWVGEWMNAFSYRCCSQATHDVSDKDLRMFWPLRLHVLSEHHRKTVSIETRTGHWAGELFSPKKENERMPTIINSSSYYHAKTNKFFWSRTPTWGHVYWLRLQSTIKICSSRLVRRSYLGNMDTTE